MKLQLFLDNHEIDLNGTEVFPVNKTYENLENPMDIISEYSKSINIPMSVINNKILANAYRLDRELVYNKDNTNIGLYFDPNKRIPMRLVYNNDIILDGYAKYLSSTSSLKDNYYTLNLFGILGDIFLKLKKVVVSKDRLTQDQIDEEDGGLKYVLNDYKFDEDGNSTLYNIDFVNKSWDLSNSDIGELDPTKTYYENGVENVYGAAPTYCGYYPDFDSTRVQISATESVPISECLKSNWINQYYKNNNITTPTTTQKEAAEEFVDNLDPDEVVGDGFKDYQMRDYRAYKQRPFIYFNKLLYMFKNKISELSDYKLVLDDGWFNIANPYWSKLCYMFDFLQKEDENQVNTKPCFDAVNDNYWNGLNWNGKKAVIKNLISTHLDATTTSNTVLIKPFTIGLDLKTDKNIKTRLAAYQEYPFKPDRIWPVYTTSWQISITVDDGTESETKIFYASTMPFDSINTGNWYWSTLPTAENFLPYSEGEPDKNPFGFKFRPYINEWCAYINIPTISFTGDYSNLNGNQVKFIVNVETATTAVKGNNINFTDVGDAFFQAHSYDKAQMVDRQSINITGGRLQGEGEPDYLGTYSVCISNGECERYRNEIEVGLQSFYKKEEPIFDIVLQYTKMFGLKWDVDYINKEIRLLRRESLFQNYTVENWDDKLDKSKQIKIEPVIFPNKYLKFAYDDVDGYKYTAYKEKYGSVFGDKIVSTLYDFNSEDKSIIKNISPTIASNRNSISFDQWLNWNCVTRLTPSIDNATKLECANEDDESSIDVANWCFRTMDIVDVSKNYYVTDDSDLMISEGKSYYYDYRFLDLGVIDNRFYTKRNGLPAFSPVWKSTVKGFSDYGKYYSCLFNTPQEDYTKDQLFTNAMGNTIYDICWDKFINERYNAQNKKMTAYFNLSIPDYNQFKFNKLVNIDNQLFMVNKIINFEPTKNQSTQCELIQVSDINVYTIPRDVFEKVQIGSNATLINNIYTLNTTSEIGVFTFIVRSYPTSNMTINTTNPLVPPSMNGNVQISNITEEGNIKTYSISYSLMNAYACSFIITLEIGDETYQYICLVQREGEVPELVTIDYNQSFNIYKQEFLPIEPILDIEVPDVGDIPTEDRLSGVRVHQVGNVHGAVTSNMTGFCTLPVLKDKPIFVIAESPDPTYGLKDVVISRTPINKNMSIVYTTNQLDVQQYLTTSYTVKSVVTDSNGNPIANVKVEQGRDDYYNDSLSTITDENGEFELDVIIGFNSNIRCSIGDKVQLFNIPRYYENIFIPAFGCKMLNI